MKFIPKHTEISKIAQGAMLEYMVERAEKIGKDLECADSIADHFELIGFTEPEKREELSRLLEIIKAAGVDVVE